MTSKRSRSRFLELVRLVSALVLALTVVLSAAIPALAATTTPESGPITVHEPQTYVYNLSTSELTNKATGELIARGFDDGKCPTLLPGDAVEVIPEPNVPNGNMHKGFVIVANDHYPDATGYESRGPLEVTNTATWAGATYITGLKNSGDGPMRVWSNGGGDYSSEEVSDDISYTYAKSDLDFAYYPPTVNVRFEVWNRAADRAFTADELEGSVTCTSEPNTTMLYAEDALLNRYSDNNETLGLTLHRPYIEGYVHDSSSGEWEIVGSDVYSYRGPSLNKFPDGRDSDYWNGWYDNELTIYPQWKDPLGNNQALNGSLDDYVYLRSRYNQGRTLTLDACGGTIDGYPKRIYEAEGRVFDGRLNDGVIDDEYEASTAWVPEREGYVFVGWYEDPQYTTPMESFKETVNKFRGDSDDINQRACRLYARWAIDFTDAVNVAAIPDQTYTGEPHEPALDVSYNDKKLVAGTDYLAVYENNVESGMATVSISGTGNYVGLVETAFRIRSTKSFADVSDKTSHVYDIEWLVNHKITTGYADGTFGGARQVYRQDMAAFLYRLAGSPTYVPTAADKAMFADVTEQTPHHNEIWWLASTGISRGWDEKNGTRTFRGTNAVKRQDMAAFLRRLTAWMGADDSMPVFAKNTFSDVVTQGANATPHYEDIIWLATTGVTKGWTMADGKIQFRGTNDIIRQDMAAFLHRLDTYIVEHPAV